MSFEMTATDYTEYDAWVDATTPDITDTDLDEMYRRDQEYQHSLYELAKARFETLHPFSRPDSLTRRGNILIARRRLSIDLARMRNEDGTPYAIEDWRETIERLFNGRVTIYSIDIDRKRNLRVRFTPHVRCRMLDVGCEKQNTADMVRLHDGSYCIGDLETAKLSGSVPLDARWLRHLQSALDWLSWCAERRRGY